MQYEMSQAELIEAVEFYLNEKVLKRPVNVTQVRGSEDGGQRRRVGALRVTVTDDEEHLDQRHRATAASDSL